MQHFHLPWETLVFKLPASDPVIASVSVVSELGGGWIAMQKVRNLLIPSLLLISLKKVILHIKSWMAENLNYSSTSIKQNERI